MELDMGKGIKKVIEGQIAAQKGTVVNRENGSGASLLTLNKTREDAMAQNGSNLNKKLNHSHGNVILG